MNPPAMIIAATGTQVTCSASSTTVAMPRTADGNPPRRVRIAATNNCYVRAVTTSNGAATSSDMLLTPSQPVILGVCGTPFLAFLQDAGVSPAARINISPIEV